MKTFEHLITENKELKEECQFLRKMLTDERRFFLETLKHDSVEEYKKVLHINHDHEKELQEITQKYEKEPIELTIDPKSLAEKPGVIDQTRVSQAKHRLSGL